MRLGSRGFGMPVSLDESYRAPVRLPRLARLGFEIVHFGLAVVGLAAAGRPNLAWALALVLVLNSALLAVWGQGF